VKKIIALFFLVLTAAWGFAGDKDKPKAKEKKGAIDSGSFGIYLNGKRVGTEKFSIEQESNEGVVNAEILIDDGNNKAEQRSELRVAPDGSVRLYKWSSSLPSKEESVVEPKDQLLIEHLTTAEQKKRDVPYVLPLSTVILDDNFFSQRELLIWRYLATGCVPQNGELHCGTSHFGILIPRQHTAGSSVIELLGREKVTFKGVERELNKVKLDTDGVQWIIWVDDPENHYRVIKMAIPATNIEVWRD
jgi:hypothetical protein